MTPPTTVETHDEADIEDELLFSVREMGVACFPIPGPDSEDGADE
jgi:hypothetical protein